MAIASRHQRGHDTNDASGTIFDVNPTRQQSSSSRALQQGSLNTLLARQDQSDSKQTSGKSPAMPPQRSLPTPPPTSHSFDEASRMDESSAATKRRRRRSREGMSVEQDDINASPSPGKVKRRRRESLHGRSSASPTVRDNARNGQASVNMHSTGPRMSPSAGSTSAATVANASNRLRWTPGSKSFVLVDRIGDLSGDTQDDEAHTRDRIVLLPTERARNLSRGRDSGSSRTFGRSDVTSNMLVGVSPGFVEDQHQTDQDTGWTPILSPPPVDNDENSMQAPVRTPAQTPTKVRKSTPKKQEELSPAVSKKLSPRKAMLTPVRHLYAPPSSSPLARQIDDSASLLLDEEWPNDQVDVEVSLGSTVVTPRQPQHVQHVNSSRKANLTQIENDGGHSQKVPGLSALDKHGDHVEWRKSSSPSASPMQISVQVASAEVAQPIQQKQSPTKSIEQSTPRSKRTSPVHSTGGARGLGRDDESAAAAPILPPMQVSVQVASPRMAQAAQQRQSPTKSIQQSTPRRERALTMQDTGGTGGASRAEKIVIAPTPSPRRRLTSKTSDALRASRSPSVAKSNSSMILTSPYRASVLDTPSDSHALSLRKLLDSHRKRLSVQGSPSSVQMGSQRHWSREGSLEPTPTPTPSRKLSAVAGRKSTPHPYRLHTLDTHDEVEEVGGTDGEDEQGDVLDDITPTKEVKKISSPTPQSRSAYIEHDFSAILAEEVSVNGGESANEDDELVDLTFEREPSNETRPAIKAHPGRHSNIFEDIEIASGKPSGSSSALGDFDVLEISEEELSDHSNGDDENESATISLTAAGRNQNVGADEHSPQFKDDWHSSNRYDQESSDEEDDANELAIDEDVEEDNFEKEDCTDQDVEEDEDSERELDEEEVSDDDEYEEDGEAFEEIDGRIEFEAEHENEWLMSAKVSSNGVEDLGATDEVENVDEEFLEEHIEHETDLDPVHDLTDATDELLQFQRNLAHQKEGHETSEGMSTTNSSSNVPEVANLKTGIREVSPPFERHDLEHPDDDHLESSNAKEEESDGNEGWMEELDSHIPQQDSDQDQSEPEGDHDVESVSLSPAQTHAELETDESHDESEDDDRQSLDRHPPAINEPISTFNDNFEDGQYDDVYGAQYASTSEAEEDEDAENLPSHEESEEEREIDGEGMDYAIAVVDNNTQAKSNYGGRTRFSLAHGSQERSMPYLDLDEVTYEQGNQVKSSAFKRRAEVAEQYDEDHESASEQDRSKDEGSHSDLAEEAPKPYVTRRDLAHANSVEYNEPDFSHRPADVAVQTSPRGHIIEQGVDAPANDTIHRSRRSASLLADNASITLSNVMRHRTSMLASRPSMVEVSSMNRDAAARAAAILKKHHKYIQYGTLEANLDDDTWNQTLLGETSLPHEEILNRSREANTTFGTSNLAAREAAGQRTPVLANDIELPVAAVTPDVPGAFPSRGEPSTPIATSQRALTLSGKNFVEKVLSSHNGRYSVDCNEFSQGEWFCLDRLVVAEIVAHANRQRVENSTSKSEALLKASLSFDRRSFLQEYLAAHSVDLVDPSQRGQWSDEKLLRRIEILVKRFIHQLLDRYPHMLDQIPPLHVDQDVSESVVEKEPDKPATPLRNHFVPDESGVASSAHRIPFRLVTSSTPAAAIGQDQASLLKDADPVDESDEAMDTFVARESTSSNDKAQRSEITGESMNISSYAIQSLGRLASFFRLGSKDEQVQSTGGSLPEEDYRERVETSIPMREAFVLPYPVSAPRMPAASIEPARQVFETGSVRQRDEEHRQRVPDQRRNGNLYTTQPDDQRSLSLHSGRVWQPSVPISHAQPVQIASTDARKKATSLSSGRRLNTGSSSFVQPTALSLLSPHTHEQARIRASAFRESRADRHWRSPRRTREESMAQASRSRMYDYSTITSTTIPLPSNTSTTISRIRSANQAPEPSTSSTSRAHLATQPASSFRFRNF